MFIEQSVFSGLKYKEVLKKQIDYLKSYDELIILGAGISGKEIYGFLKHNELEDSVKAFVDNNPDLQGGTLFHLPIFSLEHIMGNLGAKDVKNVNFLFVVGTMDHDNIQKQLEGEGVSLDRIDHKTLFIAKSLASNINQNPVKDIQGNIKKYEKVYSLLEDEKSRNVYKGVLTSKMTLNNEYLRQVATSPKHQYFSEDIYQLTDDEVFCDCGSFDGDTLESFIKKANNSYLKYVAIEADPKNYEALKARVLNKNYKNVDMYNVACWNQSTILTFVEENTSSRVSETGTIKVQAVKLDEILESEQITILKMDIEGAETNALIGAREIIKRDEPILAICIYHSIEEYFSIPLLIKEINPDYKIYIRHYTERYNLETVCYAIPPHRLLPK